MARITPFETYGMWNRSFSNFQDCENVVLLYSVTVGVSLGDLTKIFLIDNLKLHKNKYFLNRFCSVFFNHLAGLFIAGQRYIGQLVTSAEASINIMTNEFKIVTESIYYRSIHSKFALNNIICLEAFGISLSNSFKESKNLACENSRCF